MLQVQLPLGLRDVDLEVMVIVQPLTSMAEPKTWEQPSWQPGFFRRWQAVGKANPSFSD
jgi:hypothetical protein